MNYLHCEFCPLDTIEFNTELWKNHEPVFKYNIVIDHCSPKMNILY